MIIVLPSSLANLNNIFINVTADVLSSPLVGSSNNIIAGSVSNSLPIFTRFFSPPLILLMGVSAHLLNRNRRMVRFTSLILRWRSHFGGSRNNAV